MIIYDFSPSKPEPFFTLKLLILNMHKNVISNFY